MKKFTIKYTKVTEEEVSFNKYIAIRVNKLREDKGLTQEDFGKQIGLSRTSVINIEKGKQQMTLKNLYLICNFFDIKSTNIMPF